MLQQAAAAGATVVLYESPYRTRATVEWIRDLFGADTRVVIARELTKIHEEYIRGPASQVLAALESRELKGEVVILFETLDRKGAEGPELLEALDEESTESQDPHLQARGAQGPLL